MSLSIVIHIILWLIFPHAGQSDNNSTSGTLERLSAYEFFSDIQGMQPADRVFPYELNTPLFSDYAWKKRFIYLPEGKLMEYRETEAFEFPVGSALIKNFYYPYDFRDESKGYRIIETRLLLREDSGWKALPYIWNEDQSDAVLAISGGLTRVDWKHFNGKKKSLDYLVPNINQCKGCHSVNGEMSPIGPKARHLNREGVGRFEGTNQLEAFLEIHILQDHTGTSDLTKNAVWNDPSSGSLELRARSYLDINCAHCHSQDGPASNTGLYLGINQTDPVKLGIFKAPVAAGTASGKLQFDIVPGKPGESILLQRMITDDVAARMPEIGRSVMDEEGVELIREWIRQMEED